MQAEIEWLRTRTSSRYSAAGGPSIDETPPECAPPSLSPSHIDTSASQPGISAIPPFAGNQLPPSPLVLDISSPDVITNMSASQVSARSLGGITIDAFKVDDCFSLYVLGIKLLELS